MKLSLLLLIVVIVVELVWLGGIYRDADRYSVSVEAAELSNNP